MLAGSNAPKVSNNEGIPTLETLEQRDATAG
jgi:hypothetical protein